MSTAQATKPAEVIKGLRELGEQLGYEVVVQPGPMDAVVMIVWETATVAVNSRFPIERQAEELVYLMALLVEQDERHGYGPQLTCCQEAQVVHVVAACICAELGLAWGRPTSLEIPGVWASVDPMAVSEVEVLVARVAVRVAAHVITRS